MEHSNRSMQPVPILCLSVLLFVATQQQFAIADAKIILRTFHVGNLTISRLCQSTVITAVNGKLPGPTIDVHEGDTLLVHVINESPYDLTIHWHGIFQKLSAWADGPNMITQCPIQSGGSYVYRFNVMGQEGTLWWHAHVSYLRATVHGPLIIRPREAYPFPKPDKEVTIILGEWWKDNVVDVDTQALLTGGVPNISDAFTINGKPGDQYECSKDMYRLTVYSGKTYLLRIINAALDHQLFFKVAGHSFTVVAIDATYTNPYTTDVIVTAPGQTVDALMVADASPSLYYMSARAYASSKGAYNNSTATAILQYNYNTSLSSSSQPLAPKASMPVMPAATDTDTAHRFYTGPTSLVRPGNPTTVPLEVSTRMFVAFGLGLATCQPQQLLCNQTRGALAASMNNVSFQFPTGISLLEAHYKGANGVYTTDFPNKPAVLYDFTSNKMGMAPFTEKATKVKRLRYNETVELVLQNTAILGTESHPIHLHGFNFFVLAQDFGNYEESKARAMYNLVDPQVRNTVAVPAGGWAVIRFVANNPGVWIMHCHLDMHLPMGLATVFEVEDGPTADAILPPPPSDFPIC
ncbi:Laccase [Rhynchospora pubera]|uniref:Laccase n=1 Tax=Rhynchospora pubera TaxID=906938 RepID=A0AAV8EEG0_9POAL|nr:Laccase [Rhynchospora pubera]